MEQITHPKYRTLQAYLRKCEQVAIAFSGGVDSSFLLAAAADTLGEHAIGITIDSPSLAQSEKEDAIMLANLLGVKHLILFSDVIEEEIRMNPVNRCYFCKKVEYGDIKKEAAKFGIHHVLDGSNADDLKDYRPGMKARDEVQVSSPLQELGFTKAEIRSCLKEMGLPFWDKPAAACLYSRIPYGKEIRREDLHKVELGEKLLKDMGFSIVRVRCHDDLARIEVAESDLPRLVQEETRSRIIQRFKNIGFTYTTIDLLGYRMGGFNPIV